MVKSAMTNLWEKNENVQRRMKTGARYMRRLPQQQETDAMTSGETLCAVTSELSALFSHVFHEQFRAQEVTTPKCATGGVDNTACSTHTFPRLFL